MRSKPSGSGSAFHHRTLMKIHGGSTRSDRKSLCSNCRFATIVRGQTLDEEVVHCQSVTEEMQLIMQELREAGGD